MSLTKVSYSMIEGAPLNVVDYGVDETGATDCSVALQVAINAAAAAGKALDFGTGSYRFSSTFVFVNGSVQFLSSGASFEQEGWGYPIFVIQSSNVSFLGKYNFAYNGSRAAVISGNTINLPGWTAGNYKDYGSAILMNSVGHTPTDCYFDCITVFGFINAMWFTSDQTRLNYLEFDTCDMGITGGEGSGQSVGTIVAKNITNSQGVSGHAVYLNSLTGVGSVTIDSVHVEGCDSGANPYKSGGYDSFSITSLTGNDLAGIGNAQENTNVYLGKVDVKLTKEVGAAFGYSYALLAVGANSYTKIGSLNITTTVDSTDCPNLIQSSTNAKIVIDSLVVNGTTSSASQPTVAFTSSNGSLFINESNIQFLNSVCSNALFKLLTYTDVVIKNPYVKNNGTPPFLLANTFASGQKYNLMLNPNLIVSGLAEGGITCTANQTFNVQFDGISGTATAITGSTPIITHTNYASISQGAPANLTALRRFNVGQEFLLFNSDGNTNIVHNASAGADGNILTTTGTTVLRGAWSYAMFKKVGLDMVMLWYRA
jgi:hypothetical protein